MRWPQREKGTPLAEFDLADLTWSDGNLIAFMMAHPVLIHRPTMVTDEEELLSSLGSISAGCFSNRAAVSGGARWLALG